MPERGRPSRRLEGGRVYRSGESGDRDEGGPDPGGRGTRDRASEPGDGRGAGGRTEPGRAGGRSTGGDPDRSAVATATSVLRAVPGFAKLLYRLMTDARVSPLDRGIFGATLLYLVMPADLIPDVIPGLGAVDDLVLLGVALDRLLYRTDSGILLEHWDGDPYPLVKIRELLDRVTEALPLWAQWLIRSG